MDGDEQCIHVGGGVLGQELRSQEVQTLTTSADLCALKSGRRLREKTDGSSTGQAGPRQAGRGRMCVAKERKSS